MQQTLKMTETLANGYSYDSAQRELSNEYQHDRVQIDFQKFLHSCALDESSLSIERVKAIMIISDIDLAEGSLCFLTNG